VSLSARSVSRLAIFVAVATVLQIAESLVPKPLPWLRLGLANAVTLLVLIRWSVAAAAVVTVVRLGLGGLVLGTLGSPAFLLSTAGALAALAVMALAVRAAMPPLSPLGVSVLGAAVHVGGQRGAFSVLFGVGSAALVLAPLLVSTAVPLGLVSGAVVLAVHRRLPAW
jgi:heptaprenyl diphosphate synthase